MLVHVLIRVALDTPAALFVLLTEPSAEPRCGIPINESISGRNRAKTEIVGPSSKFLVQSGYHLFGVEPFHISSCLDMYRFDHALDALLRWASAYIREDLRIRKKSYAKDWQTAIVACTVPAQHTPAPRFVKEVLV